MRRFITIAALFSLLMASITGPAEAISAQTVKSGLNFPAAFTFASDGRIFFGERFTGQIRILDPATGIHTLFFTVPNVLGWRFIPPIPTSRSSTSTRRRTSRDRRETRY